MNFDPQSIYELISGKLENWITTAIEMLPNLVMALLVMLLFYVLAKIIRKFTGKLLSRVTGNKTVTALIQTVLAVLVIGIGVFFALSILNLDGTVTSLLAGAGIIGLALGFAFQDIAANFISGILLSIRHPFGIGDIIETNDYFGTVQKLNLRNTVIRTAQGQIVYVPNKVVYENPFTNYTKNGERRIDLACGISYGDDLEKVKKVALDAISSVEQRDQDRDVEFYFYEFGGSSINFYVRFWVDFHKHPDFWSAQSEAIIKLKKAFDNEDIMIPFPIRTLDFGIRGGEKLNTMLPDTSSANGSEGNAEGGSGE
ncbi:mechanosensitive ion channel family protein [Gracilimonas mengyeensis]|uniref:Conserved TM helix n=1 Tax=Gracilimonas mengyeensis TaxID=1302730 RepID=A0A521BJG1_9BACT|nr:mechanosensitive ion channel family protein [Gracilimonas mengyeensis]SMO47219.1 Conserved TM helix [Gracilimonas mengyeensis]